jgi:hypothetical protein
MTKIIQKIGISNGMIITSKKMMLEKCFLIKRLIIFLDLIGINNYLFKIFQIIDKL